MGNDEYRADRAALETYASARAQSRNKRQAARERRLWTLLSPSE